MSSVGVNSKTKKKVVKAATRSKVLKRKPATKAGPKSLTTKAKKPQEKNSTQKAGHSSKAHVKKSLQTKSQPVSSVQLPTNMSQRAITKSLTFKAYYKQLFPYIVQGVAVLCIVAGSTLALYSSFNSASTNQLAATCLAGVCANTTDSSTLVQQPTLTTAPLTPIVNLTEPLPAEISTQIQLKLQTTNTSKLVVALENNFGVIIKLQQTNISTDLYSILIPGDSLPPAKYLLRAIATASDGTRSNTVLGTFLVNDTQVSTTQLDQNSSISTTTPTIKQNATSSGIEVSTPVPDSDVDVKTIPTSRDISIKVNQTTITERTPIFIKTNTPVSFVELYAHRENALSPLFLGLAEFLFDSWVYVLEPQHLPAGAYSLYGRSIDDQKRIITSNSIPITILKNPTVEQASSSINTAIAHPPYIAAVPPEEIDINEVTDSVLKAYETDIQAKLNEYATALRSGDGTLLTLAIKNLSDLRNDMLMRVYRQGVTDAELSLASDELSATFTILQDKVSTFEQLQAKRKGVDAADTDGDGVTDTDETLLYGTDPNNPDTDNDGFADGVEIIQGFNPLDSAAEALVVYELPTRDITNVREDILEIASVVPQIHNDEAGEMAAVHSVITGKALPNSYVTLYIFSTPTIVTVRTDIDGSFEYTLTKELEDGSHEVYVAITDNTGAIVARSTAFSFVKEAQAYTSNATPSIVPTRQPEIVAASGHLYVTTFGLAVLAFGLLLLLIGFGMNRNRSIIITNATT